MQRAGIAVLREYDHDNADIDDERMACDPNPVPHLAHWLCR
jgi:hypothetical protein